MNADSAPWSDEFRALVEQARDALDALLGVSGHDSWHSPRSAYGELRRALSQDDEERRREEARDAALRVRAAAQRRSGEDEGERQAAMNAPRAAWGAMSSERREYFVLELVGERAMTISEVRDRVNSVMATPDTYRAVHTSDVRRVMMRMHDGGQLDRTPETFQGKLRYRFSRRRDLDGPIADLERTYRDEGGAAA